MTVVLVIKSVPCVRAACVRYAHTRATCRWRVQVQVPGHVLCVPTCPRRRRAPPLTLWVAAWRPATPYHTAPTTWRPKESPSQCPAMSKRPVSSPPMCSIRHHGHTVRPARPCPQPLPPPPPRHHHLPMPPSAASIGHHHLPRLHRPPPPLPHRPPPPRPSFPSNSLLNRRRLPTHPYRLPFTRLSPQRTTTTSNAVPPPPTTTCPTISLSHRGIHRLPAPPAPPPSPSPPLRCRFAVKPTSSPAPNVNGYLAWPPGSSLPQPASSCPISVRHHHHLPTATTQAQPPSPASLPPAPSPTNSLQYPHPHPLRLPRFVRSTSFCNPTSTGPKQATPLRACGGV